MKEAPEFCKSPKEVPTKCNLISLFCIANLNHRTSWSEPPDHWERKLARKFSFTQNFLVTFVHSIWPKRF
jgi:hypothetical protein